MISQLVSQIREPFPLDKSKVLMTMPGLIGDNFAMCPIAYQYSKQYKIPVDICLDNYSAIMKSVLNKQDWIKNIFLSDGIQHQKMGGQPYDFGRHEEFLKYYEKVYHLGFKKDFSSNVEIDADITKMLLVHNSDVPIDVNKIFDEPCIKYEKKKIKYLCVHIDSNRYLANAESQSLLRVIFKKIHKNFDKIFFIGLHRDPNLYKPFLNNKKCVVFDDGGDLNKIVDLFSESILYGTYSSMRELARCMMIDQITVMSGWNPLSHRKSKYAGEYWVMDCDYKALEKAFMDLMIKNDIYSK